MNSRRTELTFLGAARTVTGSTYLLEHAGSRVLFDCGLFDSMSAHADRGEIRRWLRTIPVRPGRLCLVHGEPGPMDALRDLVQQQLAWTTCPPHHGETMML